MYAPFIDVEALARRLTAESASPDHLSLVRETGSLGEAIRGRFPICPWAGPRTAVDRDLHAHLLPSTSGPCD